MAFQKSHTVNSGVSGDHWQIAMVSVDVVEARALARVNLYKDSTKAAEQNATPLGSYTVIIDGLTFAQFIADISPTISPPAPPSKDAVTAFYELLGAMSDKPWFGGDPVQDVYWWVQ